MKTSIINLCLLLSLVFLVKCKPSKNRIKTINTMETVGYPELKDSILLDLVHSKILEYPDNTQFSIAAMKNGTPYYYGIKNENGNANKIINNNKAFEIGSITKVFTTDLLAKNILSGQLKLEDNISDLIEMELNCSNPITLKQLASHSSGLPIMPASFWESGYEENNPYKNFGKSELTRYLANEISVDTSMANKFSYSNIGISILGYMLEEINEKKYENLLQERILTPLKMNNTSLNRSSLQEILVSGIKLNGEEGQNWDLEAVKPAGGIYSTTEDLVKYIQYCSQNENKVFALQSEAILKRNKSMDQALGWMIINSKTGDKFYCHAGGTGAYSSILVMNTKTKNAIVLLSNIETEDSSIDLFGFKLMKELN